MKLLYDPAIPQLGTYPEETIIQKDICTPMFTQHYLQWPGHGSNLDVHQRWIDQEFVVHIYNEILLSHKMNKVDEPRAYYTECSKSEREKQIPYISLYIWTLDKWYWWAYLQGRKGDAYVENGLVNTPGGQRGWDNMEK